LKPIIKKAPVLIFIIGLLFISLSAIGQEEETKPKETGLTTDSVGTTVSPIVEVETKHMANKATMYSAVLPGLGQIYNHQLWKVPIVYGGFIGLAYLVDWNQQRLSACRQYYFDLADNNPNTTSYKEIWPNVDFTNSSNVTNKKSTLLNAIEAYRRQRDLCIIGTVGFYLFNILDANVGANLIDFDISESLSFNVQPIATDPWTNTPILGTRLVYTF
jgi:hypothetical protein